MEQPEVPQQNNQVLPSPTSIPNDEPENFQLPPGVGDNFDMMNNENENENENDFDSDNKFDDDAKQDSKADLNSVVSFVSILYQMVDNKENYKYIHWNEEDGGQSFNIVDPVAFSKEVLPRNYKHTNFCGFTRQLTLYGFKKVCYLRKKRH